PILARHFAHPKQLSKDAQDLLISITDWPGNVRQLRKIVENACKLTEGYSVDKTEIARQLEYQDMRQASAAPVIVSEAATPPQLTFVKLKQDWQDGELKPADLERALHSLYENGRQNWRRVGKALGVTSEEGMKAFRNWIYYLQRTNAIRLPEK